MANLTENDAFDSGVYQWETTDSALGGPLGVMNRPLLSLVNRSRYLLNRLMDGALGFMADNGAKNAIAATLTQPMPGLVDGVKVAFRTKVTNDGAVTLALTNATGGPALATLPVYGNDQAALIGGEFPAGSVVNVRLNTALNAANGGAWVVESISGGYANIPTAPTGDMTKKAANMAAIFAATDGYQVVDVSGSTDTVLTQAQYGVAMLKLTGVLGASKNLILPAQSGQWIIDNEATGNFNLTAKAAGSSGSTVILPAGSPVIVCSDGTNVKFASAGGQSYMKAYPFSGLATNTLTITGGYTPGAILVERNGALIQPGTSASPDYTATDGATVVLATALTSDEWATVYTFATFSVANAVQKSGDTMGGPLALYQGSTVSTPAALDNSAAVANTAAMNRVGGVVGSVRNGVMVVGVVSSTATYTADEVILETALGGAPFRASAVNQAINLAATGAGGISGSLTASGYAATYLIYGPVTGLSNITIDATSTVAPEVCPAGNIPSGYTASALVSVWPLNASKQFIVGSLYDRFLNFAATGALSTSGVVATPAAFTLPVPKNAKHVNGSLSLTVSAGAVANLSLFDQTATGASSVSVGRNEAGAGGTSQNFALMPILTPQTLYYSTSTSAGSITNITVTITGYRF
jgi:hypothetical protein